MCVSESPLWMWLATAISRVYKSVPSLPVSFALKLLLLSSYFSHSHLHPLPVGTLCSQLRIQKPQIQEAQCSYYWQIEKSLVREKTPRKGKKRKERREATEKRPTDKCWGSIRMFFFSFFRLALALSSTCIAHIVTVEERKSNIESQAPFVRHG